MMTAFRRCEHCDGQFVPMNYVGDVVGSICTCTHASFADRAELTRLRAEVENLRSKAAAFDEWHAKTEWVQETAEARELGMHRADVMRKRIEALRGQVAAKDLLLDGWMAASLPGGGGWIDALRAYAERYRWLRDYAGRGSAGSIFDNFSGPAIDKCIDAARAAQGGEHD